MGLIPNEVEAYYLRFKESERLSNPFGELERLRTQAILARYLPPPPAVIVDAGGATGAYAVPLARQGYQVHLIDPVELHVNHARSYASASGVRLASLQCGDASQLDIPSGSADAVLLFGPLYHLVGLADRSQALREARRVLRHEGVLLAAGISRFASFVDGLSSGAFQDSDFRKIVGRDLASGQHRNQTGKIEYFTTAYFHRPEELAVEVREAGFSDVRVLAVEGPAWSAARFRSAWDDPVQRSSLMEFLSEIEEEPSIRGASAHLIAVAHPSN